MTEPLDSEQAGDSASKAAAPSLSPDPANEIQHPVATPAAANGDCPDPGDTDRLLTLALHEEKMLSDRINIFLIVESLLLSVYFGSGTRMDTVLEVIILVLGVLVAVLWLLSNVRQSDDLRCAAARLRQAWAELAIIDRGVEKSLKKSSLILTVYGLPLMFGVIWGFLLARLIS